MPLLCGSLAVTWQQSVSERPRKLPPSSDGGRGTLFRIGANNKNSTGVDYGVQVGGGWEGRKKTRIYVFLGFPVISPRQISLDNPRGIRTSHPLSSISGHRFSEFCEKKMVGQGRNKMQVLWSYLHELGHRAPPTEHAKKEKDEKKKRTRRMRTRKSRTGSDDGLSPRVGEKIGHGDLEGIIIGDAQPQPEHLVILVNGIVGCASNWTFAAERMRSTLGQQFAIHCSGSSSARKTFDGVDVMGNRLANEVREIIDKTPGVKKISFVSHSLGGLVSRYAIALLYCPPTHGEDFGEGVMDPSLNSKITTVAAESEFTIGGLRPENFITLATPHLGCKGVKQLPFLFGIRALERTAAKIAHCFVGNTGKHLFLTDGKDSELPLLRRMVADCKEEPFMSSLALFKRRAAYANVINDRVVGWRTSSIRLEWERPKADLNPVYPKYPHIIREEDPPSFHPVGNGIDANVRRPPGENVQGKVSLEEEIVAGLMQVPWHRVDVLFRGTCQAHDLIQVKNPKIHSAGADVIQHVIDKQFGADQEET